MKYIFARFAKPFLRPPLTTIQLEEGTTTQIHYTNTLHNYTTNIHYTNAVDSYCLPLELDKIFYDLEQSCLVVHLGKK